MFFEKGDVSAIGAADSKFYARGRGLRSDISTSLFMNILLSLLFAAATGACARVRVHLPFTPVPVTGQVFAVLMSGAILGPWFGALSQILYVGIGIAGIPWFAVGPIGPTGGYLVGFVVAPLIIGRLGKRFPAMLAGIAAIYTLGLLQFSIFTGRGLLASIPLAVLPFIPFDLAKCLIATLVASPFRRMDGR